MSGSKEFRAGQKVDWGGETVKIVRRSKTPDCWVVETRFSKRLTVPSDDLIPFTVGTA